MCLYYLIKHIYIYIYILGKATEFFWIPEDIKNLISTYFKCTYVRFSNNKYSTNR